MGWWTPRSGCFTTPGKIRYPLCSRLGGSRGRSGQVAENLASNGIRSVNRPASSESLYRMNYPGPIFIVINQGNLTINTLENTTVNCTVDMSPRWHVPNLKPSLITFKDTKIQFFRDVTPRLHVNILLISISLQHAAYICMVCRCSSVGIVNRYKLDGPGIESRWGRYFPHSSRPVLGPTQLTYELGTGPLTGRKAAEAWRWPPIST
jgi:hypothetical protein